VSRQVRISQKSALRSFHIVTWQWTDFWEIRFIDLYVILTSFTPSKNFSKVSSMVVSSSHSGSVLTFEKFHRWMCMAYWLPSPPATISQKSTLRSFDALILAVGWLLRNLSVDLYGVLTSFTPSNGVIKSVTIYSRCVTWVNAKRCKRLQHAATHCNALQHTASHCNTLQHTATQSVTIYPRCVMLVDSTRTKMYEWVCNNLQHTATHCNTLQHPATHCDTLCHPA